MADGKIEIGIELDDSKAGSQAKKAGSDIAKGVEQGLKGAGKAAEQAAKDIEKPIEQAAKTAKDSMKGVGDAAKSGFSGVGDAARSASSDASSAFESIPADAKGAFADVGSEAKSGFDGIADAANSAAGDAAGAFEQVGDAIDDVGEHADDAADKVDDTFRDRIPAGSLIAVGAIAAVALKLLDIGKNAIQAGADFDKNMSQVAATMGITVDQIGELRDFAKEMGETTAFSASQAAQALNYMALAGYDAETSMRVLPTVLNLAAAGGMELAAASDMVTDAQSALGLSVEQAEVMVDQMAKTSSKTNTSVEQLGNAFLTVGGTAKNLKGGTAELAQMLGILADNGIKGSEGGTALRNVILSLSAPTDKAAESIKALGLEVFDAEGNMREMPAIFNDLNAALASMTQQERTQVLNEIFNKVDLKSVNALLGTSADRFDQVADAIDHAQGAAAQMAETQLDNLAGDVTLLESATEGFFIAVSDQLAPALRELVQFLTNNVMPALTFIAKNFDKVAPAVGGAVVAMAGLGLASKVMKVLRDESGMLAAKLKLTTAEFKAMSTQQKLAAVATEGLGKAFKALRSIGIVLAISAAVEIIAALVNSFQEAKKKAEDWEKATTGLERAASGASLAIGDEVDAFKSLNQAIDSVDMDAIVEQHIKLAESIEEVNSRALASTSMLSQYGDAVMELAGRSDLSEAEVAKLRLAIDGINETAGTSYEVIQNEAGAYVIMADGAEVAKEAIYNLVEAQNALIRAEAEAENYRNIYNQMIGEQEELAKATKAAAEAEQLLNDRLDYLGGNRYVLGTMGETIDLAAQEQAAFDEASAKVDQLNESMGYMQSALNKTEEQQILTNMALADGASQLVKNADANLAYRAGVQEANVDLVAFTQALEHSGFTAEQVASLTTEQAYAMAEGWKGGTDGLIAATEEAGVEVPAALRAMGADAKNEAYLAGEGASKGLYRGLSDNGKLAVKEALAIKGLTIEEFDKMAAEAGIEGEDAAVAFAQGIASGEIPVDNAATSIARSGSEAFASADNRAVGLAESGEFAQGVAAGSGKAEDSGEAVARAAGEGYQSQNDNASVWGSHLSSAFAGGITSQIGSIADAARRAAEAVTPYLKHSIPKDGPLREGGKGEALWGEHLVENIAEGMTSRKAQEAIKDATEAVAVDINESLLRQLDDIDPLAQMQASLSHGAAALSLSAMMTGTAPSYTTNNQTLNFNQPVESPDEFARFLRLQERYGLAGNL